MSPTCGANWRRRKIFLSPFEKTNENVVKITNTPKKFRLDEISFKRGRNDVDGRNELNAHAIRTSLPS